MCVQDNASEMGMGGWLTPSAWWHHSQVSMEWRSSSVLSPISIVFPWLKCRGSVSYQAISTPPPKKEKNPHSKHSNVFYNAYNAILSQLNTRNQTTQQCRPLAVWRSPYTRFLGKKNKTKKQQTLISIIRFKPTFPCETAGRKRIPQPPWSHPILLSSGTNVAHSIDCWL